VAERWTRWVLKHRVPVLAVWLAVLVGGAYAATLLPPLLANSFAIPGTESERARALLARHFDERPDGTFVVVFRSRGAANEQLRLRLARAARALPGGHVRALRTSGLVAWAELVTPLDLQHAKRYTDTVRRALRAREGPAALVTGQPAIQHDLDPILSSDLGRGEALAVPLALLVLLVVFGATAAVAIPSAFAACTILGTLAVVYGLAHALAMTTYVTNLVGLIGLGLAIDYSLLIVHRFREELDGGRASEDAVARTMATAGRTVLYSGTAVAIGLGLLLLVPVPFVRSMGAAGLVVPLVSLAAVASLQPALLSLLGRRATRSRRMNGVWERLARGIMRRPVPILVGATALLLLLAAPALRFRLSPGSFSGIPSSTEAARGLELLRDGVGSGAVTPTHVVVDSGAPDGAARPAVRSAVSRLADELASDPEVLLVASGRRAPYIDASRRYARVIVVGRHEFGGQPTLRLVRRLRDRLVPRARFPAGVRIDAGGAPPQGVDFLHSAYSAFPWVVAGVLAVTLAALLGAFRSLLLPLKAVVLNLLTVAAVYGLLVVVFQWAGGGEVEGWVPIFLFAVLFGLSMDYEVFLVTRMREAWDEHGDNALAVAHGLERTGPVVTSAALIMIAAFSGFLTGRVAGLRQLGLGLSLAILLDATVVRALLVPSLMAVLGRWSWWLPGREGGAPERSSLRVGPPT
jgi:trehalose monomycolate/heme transporter